MPRTTSADEFRQLSPQRFDLVVIGSGFRSLFYLHECLAHLPPNARIAVLERGTHSNHNRQLEMGANATLPDDGSRPYDAEAFYGRPHGHKPWNFTIGLGGGTLCWWGQAPRLHPSDFRMSSLYGHGADWPVGYDDLEPFYSDAEDIMGVAGDSARVGPFRRTRRFPRFGDRVSMKRFAKSTVTRLPCRPRATALAWRGRSAVPSAIAGSARTTPSSPRSTG